MQAECDGEGATDGEVLGVPVVEPLGVPDGGVSDGLVVGVADELGLGVGLPVVLAVGRALGEGVAVLPPLPCLA
jgi:hypothetical protein